MRLSRYLVITLVVFGVGHGARAQSVGLQEISLTEGNLASGALSFSDYFGSSVASVGDIDRDGVLDLLVGVEGDDEGGQDVGSVRLLFMNSDGTVRSTTKIGSSQLPAGALEPGDYFGSSVAGLQDLDGDGFRDIAVGARGDNDSPANLSESAGALWILFLDDSGTVIRSQKISLTEGGFLGPLDAGDMFGRSVAFLGDIGENGTKEIAVGAPGDDSGGPDRGAVWILSLLADGTVADAGRVTEVEGLGDYDMFGTSVATLSRRPDGGSTFAVGAPFSDLDGADAGAIWFVDLTRDVILSGATRADVVVASTPRAAGDHFGRSLTSPGDLNDNGTTDLLVGSPGHDEAVDDSGEFWFMDLQPGASAEELGRFLAPDGDPSGPGNAGDRFGQSMAAIGDLDGDGKVDYAVGAPYGDDGLENAGSVYVIFDERALPVGTESLPSRDLVIQRYPNPMRGRGFVQIRLASDAHVRIDVFDVVGRHVARIHNSRLPGGVLHALSVDARNWPSGTYLYRIARDQQVDLLPFVVVR